jgi:mannose-6-phosphate isomerase-like protein (cupin superfamily)
MADDALLTKDLSEDYDYLAPDGSEIRLLPTFDAGGLAHCLLPPAGVSSPVRHRSVEEVWFFLDGVGEVWRRRGDDERVVQVHPGRSLGIPSGVAFQFRNTGSEPLRFLIATMPQWPGPDEAEAVRDGRWPTAAS